MATVDTPADTTRDIDTLVAFNDALADTLGVTGSAASIDIESGVVSATFTVHADTVQEAVDAAVTVFNTALERVGLPPGNIVHVDVEPLGDREFAYA
jgi:hypothetical protein